MELWLVAHGVGCAEREVVVDVEDDHRVGALAEALATHLRIELPADRVHLRWVRTNEVLSASTTVGHAGLRHGDRVLVVDGSETIEDELVVGSGPPLVTLSVAGGPAAGRSFALGRGRHAVGRGQGCPITIDDPTLSRHHLWIDVADEGVTVADADSANGTFVDGKPVTDDVDLDFGVLVEVGHSLIRVGPWVSPSASTSAGAARPAAGSVGFNRPPRVASPPLERIHQIEAPPAPAQKRRLPMASALGPLLMGIPLIAMGGSMRMFGIISVVVSPLMAIVSYTEDKRTGSGQYRRDQLAFYERLRVAVAKAGKDLAEEERVRRRTSADPAELLARAGAVRADLWERRPTDPDFLALSVGWADQPALTSVELGDGGDEGLREEAEPELARLATARSLPVLATLPEVGALGVCGSPSAVNGLVRSLVLQLATLHSPRDVIVAAAFPSAARPEVSWMAWLPHLRSEASPIEGPHLALGESGAVALFEAVSGLVRSRREESQNRLSGRRPTPAVVLVVSEQLDVPRAALTTILEDGPAVAVHVVWVGEAADHLPGECGAIAEVAENPPTVRFSLPNRREEIAEALVDLVALDQVLAAARSLAGVKDVSAGGARGQIPRTVSLLELIGLTRPEPVAVAERWQHATSGIAAPVGVSAGGPFVLDLRQDGPHALVGGTTGAGKSELLQSFVAALAAEHPPTQVTFLLVDYKGGAAFKDVVELPHTVGFVTDLDGHLVGRALISLNAELRRREHLLRDHDAKDLLEMERRFPDTAPPSLLLIVDEFASLAKELPDFVDGVVNVAQRGRSLGIHLILATQRPAGAINDNVRANTNLRIALRMNDVADSQDVIAAKDAALLPRTLPGRAFARTGQSELTEVQVAYVGGHTSGTGPVGDRPVEVFDLVLGAAVRPERRADEVADDAPTDLQVLVEAIGGAARHAGIPPQTPPWLAPLPDVLELPSGPGHERAGAALLGLVDLPAEQAQRPWWFDLEEEGSLLVYGTSGSGKTTLLRSLAVSLARSHAPSELQIYGLDFASRGLAPLEALPHVGSVVVGDDVERVQRLITMLEREISRRKDQFAAAGVSLLSEHQRATATTGETSLPRIIVLLDGYGGFASTFEKIDFGEWLERFPRLVAEGRPLGIHVVVTTDRRSAVGVSLASMVGSRVVLRMADPDEYATVGLDGRVAKVATLPPGRGFVGPTLDLQVPIVGTDPSGEAQAAEVERIGAALAERHPGAAVAAVGALPLEVDRSTLPAGDELCTLFGIGQTDLGPVGVDLFDGNLLVAGPNRSGRSTALAAIAAGVRRSTPAARLFLLAPRRSPLTELDLWETAASGASACDELAAELAALLDERTGIEDQVVVIVDDGNELNDTTADSALEKLIRRGRDTAVSVVGAAESTSALRSYGGWIPEIRKDRRALLLNPDPDIDGDLVGARLPRRAGGGLPPGRGYLVLDGKVELLHVAS